MQRALQFCSSCVGAEFTRVVVDDANRTFGPMLRLAAVIRTQAGATLPVPTYNGTALKGRILGVNTQVTATDPAFGVMNLGAFKYSSDMVLVPEELLQDSGVRLSSFLGERMRRCSTLSRQRWAMTSTGSLNTLEHSGSYSRH